MESYIVHGRFEVVLPTLPAQSVDLVYIDPPFNTGKVQKHTPLTMRRVAHDHPDGRAGYGGNTYTVERGRSRAYSDVHEDFTGMLRMACLEAFRLLTNTGALYVHLDWREAHYAKVMLDEIFGRENFVNEIIWAYDYGAKSKKKWPTKHDTILYYVKDVNNYTFNADAVDREPYMAPGLVTKEKAERGKMPTDVWWHTIVPTNGKERTGYPTQKPEGVLRRIISASSNPGNCVLDFFAGSGTTGAVALALNRRTILVDENEEAISVMRDRLGLPVRTSLA